MNFSKYPNQIDDQNVNISEALIAIENTLGTNPSGSNFSTVGDRLNLIDNNIKSLQFLSSKEYLYNLKLSTLLSLGNITDGYDLILSDGDALTGSHGIVNIIGNTIITGNLNISNDINLNNGNIKDLNIPIDPNDASNKLYVDNELIKYNKELLNKINNIINKDDNFIQYSKDITQPFPKFEANKYLKRNIDNTNWEFIDLDIKNINDKINFITESIENINRNITNGYDLTVSIGDAIKSEDDYLNIDSHVVIHKTLLVHGDIDLQSHRIINSLPPERKDHIVNKQYVDTRLPTNLAIENQKKGSMLYFDGKIWISLLAGNEGDILTIKNNIPTWTKLIENG